MVSPAQISDPKTIRLLEMLGGIQAFQVRVEQASEKFKIGYCWYNSYAQSEAHGGSIVHGWLLWDDGVGVLGQHHAVWENLDGTLIDITPNIAKAPVTTFAPSPLHEFDYHFLKGWISVRCTDVNAQTLQFIDQKGSVIQQSYTKPARTRYEPSESELCEVRKLVPNAGKGRLP